MSRTIVMTSTALFNCSAVLFCSSPLLLSQDLPPVKPAEALVSRTIVMTEIEDNVTGTPVVLLLNGLGYNDPPTENPTYVSA